MNIELSKDHTCRPWLSTCMLVTCPRQNCFDGDVVWKASGYSLKEEQEVNFPMIIFFFLSRYFHAHPRIRTQSTLPPSLSLTLILSSTFPLSLSPLAVFYLSLSLSLFLSLFYSLSSSQKKNMAVLLTLKSGEFSLGFMNDKWLLNFIRALDLW